MDCYLCGTNLNFKQNQFFKMKKLLTSLCLVLCVAIAANAQIKTPAASPAAKVEQKVGLTDVTIEYSRPSAKGRTIFGDLVPYGKMWRTGANKNTMVTFSTDAMVSGTTLSKGTYAIFTVPGESEFEVIFYTDTENWGTPEKYSEEKEAARFKVKANKLPMSMETMLVSVGNITKDAATIDLMWANTHIAIPFTLSVDEVVMKDIDRVLAGPSYRDYYTAASYMHTAGKDLGKALEYAQKANEMNPKFWQLRREALILGDMKRYSDAIATAEKSIAMAKEAGNDDYVRSNTKSIAEWKAMMGKSKKGAQRSSSKGSKM